MSGRLTKNQIELKAKAHKFLSNKGIKSIAKEINAITVENWMMEFAEQIANDDKKRTDSCHIGDIVHWVAISDSNRPEPVSDVLVRFKDGGVQCRFFDGDRRFYNLANDIDITDNITHWAALPK